MGVCAAALVAALVTVRCLAGGRHKVCRNLLAKYKPSILGVVDEYVTVTLNTLNNLVTSKLPGINRVNKHPFKKHVNALEYLGNRVSAPCGAPSYPNVKTDSSNVTLNVVKGLEICT